MQLQASLNDMADAAALSIFNEMRFADLSDRYRLLAAMDALPYVLAEFQKHIDSMGAPDD